jgi:hypothetical protein
MYVEIGSFTFETWILLSWFMVDADPSVTMSESWEANHDLDLQTFK